MTIAPPFPTALRVRVIAWLNLVGNLAIIGTGGAVRLTGSGLGCPTWPQCAPGSWVPTDELGVHGVIEFSNRLMSPVLVILAALAVAFTWRFRRERGDLWRLALVLALGIIGQGAIGGITVWTGLNSWIVGIHYVASAALVAVATAFVLRSRRDALPRRRAVPGWVAALTHAASAVLLVVVLLGVVTTGAGPHSGDAAAIRNGLAWETLSHAHAWAGYALAALLVALTVAAGVVGAQRLLVAVIATLAVVAVQIFVGVAQARLGIPPLLVGIHMVLAAVTVALAVALVDATRRPAP